VFKPHHHFPAHSSTSLKANVLINHSGHACLTDFGLLTIASSEPTIASLVILSALRWMSLELINPDNAGLKESCPTKESDYYALGMTIYEVLSGQTPFAECDESAVIAKVRGGECPRRPQGKEGRLLTDAIWGVLERCWKPQPHDRISAKAVLLGFEAHPPLLRPFSNVDGDVEVDRGNRLTASDPRMFFLLHRRVISNYHWAMIGPPTIHGDNETPVPPHEHPPGVTHPIIPPRRGGLEGWIGKLVHNAREKVNTFTGRLRGL
jgi:serine/threonine protein kinase